jgi:hypothetical protein
MAGAQAAVARLAQEAVRRPSIAAHIPPGEAYKRLIAAEPDPKRALAFVEAAREQSRVAGKSIAQWDLAELELHIASGDAEQARQSLERIEREYRDDPEVGAALYRLLYEVGIIQSHAAPIQPTLDQEEPMVAVGSEAEPAGRIWTPDSDRPSGGKSTLWTPS